ncbi:Rad4-domain-containing protein [Rhizodiscina lignyota]|uniref:Rad4-domain-containing protein n=1 Tax=Rhizodiscina lignyota TaxID=1504668 RepID=A0A9P4M5N9_9PEZI|nr:Rad4-domain-containing protein [Rhizodiscina lignyota]
MAPSRKARSGVTGSARSRKKANANDHGDDVPEVFRELLIEAESSGTDVQFEDRPSKRRRVGERPPREMLTAATQHDADVDLAEDPSGFETTQAATLDSDESEESNFEWEDVGIGGGNDASNDTAAPAGVSVVLNGKETSSRRISTPRKRTVTSAERNMRLDVHKMYICCLLYHVSLRNSFCNDHMAQATLQKLLSARVRGMLKPDPNFTQTRKAALFLDGLNAITEIWKMKFSITHYGIQRPHWMAVPSLFKLPEQVEISFDRSDFRETAKSLQGSADVGAQLLCALLRSAGVAARLVCSLQPLAFAAAGASTTPQKEAPKKATVYADLSDRGDSTASDAPVETSIDQNQAGSPVVPRRITRIGQSRITTGISRDLGRPPPEVARMRRVPRPPYPIYWVEAFNEAQQKWIPVDLTATMTVGKPSKLEPPFNDPVNYMSYVIAFEDDGAAKDVTRRYAKAYNAKTRKLRVESTDGGERWLRKAMKLFRRRISLDRDQVEDAELARKEAVEGMPRNVQDFKNHPYYVLERHLRHNEVLHPRHEVGKVNAGTAASGKLEAVYRRKDVHIVRSSDKWYRLGREVKPGEQPLKHAKPRKNRNISPTLDEFGEEDDAGVGLYAVFQTELYIPPSVVRGRVPRNAYGNLDVYVPSMVPPGGVHIPSPDAVKAARLVGVDYAEAVTGFKFQGRQGTAIVQGVVVAAEYQEAVEAVIQGFQDARDTALEKKRSAEALRMWRRFMVGLRIIERMQEYRQNEEEEPDDHLRNPAVQPDHDLGGGFIPEADVAAPYNPFDDESPGGGFSPDDGSVVAEPVFKTLNQGSPASAKGRDSHSIQGEQMAESKIEEAEVRAESDEKPDDGLVMEAAFDGASEIPVGKGGRSPSENDDTGSLIDHDPDDEDAEADWI